MSKTRTAESRDLGNRAKRKEYQMYGILDRSKPKVVNAYESKIDRDWRRKWAITDLEAQS